MILHSGRECQFASKEYPRFLHGHRLLCSMIAVGGCADNAAAESFLGVLKREHVNRRQCRTRAGARADIFDYFERFHNLRKARKISRVKRNQIDLTRPSVRSG